jgi:hypothetical protein
VEIAEVKRQLAAAVAAAGIANLDTYPFVPDQPAVPCFFPGEVILDPNLTYGDGADQADITCRVLTSAGDDADGQALLDQLLSRTGPMSIRAALLAARGAPGESALNGAADDLAIIRIQGYRMYVIGDGRFYGAEIIVRVLGE